MQAQIACKNDSISRLEADCAILNDQVSSLSESLEKQKLENEGLISEVTGLRADLKTLNDEYQAEMTKLLEELTTTRTKKDQ